MVRIKKGFLSTVHVLCESIFLRAPLANVAILHGGYSAVSSLVDLFGWVIRIGLFLEICLGPKVILGFIYKHVTTRHQDGDEERYDEPG